MGAALTSVFSCCRRQKSPKRSPEHDPLLPRSQPQLFESNERAKEATQTLAHVAAVLGALRAGKLPTEPQVDDALRMILHSDLLTPNSPHYPFQGTLGKQVGVLVRDVRNVVDALLRLGMEKNYDDVLQDFVFHLTLLASTSSTSENKISLAALTRALLSSGPLRALLAATIGAARTHVADIIGEVGGVAEGVADIARGVEEVVRPGGGVSNGHAVNGRTSEEDMGGDVDDEDPFREAVLDTLQDIARQAQKDAELRGTLISLLQIASTYAPRAAGIDQSNSSIPFEGATTLTPELPPPPNPHISPILTSLRTILARLTPGFDIVRLFSHIRRTLSLPSMQSWAEDARSAALRALREPDWAKSSRGRRCARGLYIRFIGVLNEEGELGEGEALIVDLQNMRLALMNDRTSQYFLSSLTTLASDFASAEKSRAWVHWRQEALKALLGWLAPRLGQVLSAIPMPRVEFKDERRGLEAAVDAVLLSAAGGVDGMRVESWNEVWVGMELQAGDTGHHPDDPDGRSEGGRVRSASRVKVEVRGLRVAARDVGYYASYSGPLGMGYMDEGIASVDIGTSERGRGEGLSVEVDIDMHMGGSASPSSSSEEDSGEPLFSVHEVRASASGIHVSLTHTRHWILNALVVRPLLAPVARRAICWVVEGQVKGLLEGAERWMRGVKTKARDEITADGDATLVGDLQPGVWDYLSAIFSTLSGDEKQDDEGQEEGAPDVLETRTALTRKGVMHTTVTQSEPGALPEEQVIAVGVGAQVLPGVAEPDALLSHHGLVDDREGGSNELVDGNGDLDRFVAREAVGELLGVVGEAVKTGGEIVDGVREVPGEVRSSKTGEARRGGWRSRVFDIHPS
ncbi:hypothetical protein BD410DRAFT_632059 [Rickenella mellea]|uniref:HAM1-like N-terminal domain-containing protein n=1 Tax=Rickenella mellea TaxID=50990 RepID=A0A4Y7QD95_9AGAM|nr:hypothetical protein BD410DRAFT_632059 [Rickenella mellea]